MTTALLRRTLVLCVALASLFALAPGAHAALKSTSKANAVITNITNVYTSTGAKMEQERDRWLDLASALFEEGERDPAVYMALADKATAKVNKLHDRAGNQTEKPVATATEKLPTMIKGSENLRRLLEAYDSHRAIETSRYQAVLTNIQTDLASILAQIADEAEDDDDDNGENPAP